MIANEWPPDLMLKASIEAMHHGRWNLKLSDVFGLPFGLGLSVNLVPIVRQSLSSIEVKYDLRLEPKPDLGIDACDKDSGRPFRWTGHYDIAEALASACAHCSLAMPVEARQIDGKTLQLVDGVHGPSPVQHAVTPTVRFGPPETQWISRRSAVPGPFNCWGLMGGNGSNPDDLRFPNEADNVVWALVGMSDAVKRIELLDYCLTSREIDALCADGEAAGSKAAEELIPMLTATASAYASPCAVH